MIKLLHSADWHLGSPFTGKNAADSLAKALLSIPQRIAELCRSEQCQILLLSGDLFDGSPSREAIRVFKQALEAISVPVFIAPGNHDCAAAGSLWLTELWPENVHIFTKSAVTSVALPELDCRVYGAGFEAMDCAGLLEGFCARHPERYSIGIFHGDPTQVNSPYCPITPRQIRNCGLSYLALGHIHKGGQLQAGSTLCAWPGCPMGRGFDEQGEKGVLLVTLAEEASAAFVPLGLPRFIEMSLDVCGDAVSALESVLPAAGNEDFYRITLTGTSDPIDIHYLTKHFSRFPNLELHDKTQLPTDLWRSAGEDNLEGVFFQLLRDSMAEQSDKDQRITLLAAKIARQILDGQEVSLP